MTAPDGAPLTLLLMPWGRVGSNMINAVFSDLGVTVFNEPLTGIEARSGGHSTATRKIIAREQQNWLNEQLAPERLESPALINHAALSTADPVLMRDWIITRQPRLVTLDRGDDAAVALSSARAEAWIAEGAALGEKRNWSIDRNVTFRPHITPETLQQKLAMVRKGRGIMARLVAGLPVLPLFYEDLVADLDGVMAALMRHAGIPWHPYRIRTSRFGTGNLSQMVANPDELIAVLRADGGSTSLCLD